MTKTERTALFVASLFFGLVMVAAAQQDPMSDAEAALKAQDWGRASALYKKATATNPSDGKAWYGLGSASLQLGDLPAAIKAFEKSFELGVNPAYSLYNLACAYARAGKKDEALTTLQKLTGVAPRLALQAPKDEDLASVRSEPRFGKLMEEAHSKIAPCEGDAHSREFDFWVGEWDVFNRGSETKVGTSRIEKTLDGCLLIENWSGTVGDTGKSFNTVNPGTGHWQQYWVASNGTVTLYDGDIENGEMRFMGTVHARGAGPTAVRLTFTPLPDGSVRQHGEKLGADKHEWVTTYDFVYRKKQ